MKIKQEGSNDWIVLFVVVAWVVLCILLKWYYRAN